MTADSSQNLQLASQEPGPAWAETWHLWTVILPKRSISGKLVFGQVWRRRAGRRWIYKKFIEHAKCDARRVSETSRKDAFGQTEDKEGIYDGR
jgi:hypothetical protein